jgi:MraZ protein
MVNNRKARLAWLLTCGLLGLLGAAAAFKAYDGDKAAADTGDPTKGLAAAAPAPKPPSAPAKKAVAADPPPPAWTVTAAAPEAKPQPTGGVPVPELSEIKPVAAKEPAGSEKDAVVPAGGVMPQAPPETSEPSLMVVPTAATVPASSAPNAAPPAPTPPAPESKGPAPLPPVEAPPTPRYTQQAPQYVPPSPAAPLPREVAGKEANPAAPPAATTPDPKAPVPELVPVKSESPAPACPPAEMEIKPLPNLRTQPPAEQPKTVLPLTGTFQVSMDGKGGMVLSAAVRDQLGNCDTVMVSPGTDSCLWLTNQAHLRRLCQRLDQSPAREVDVRTFKRLYYAQTTRTSVSSDGRVVIGERLARFAGLSQEVVLVGIDDHFEVWDLARWRQYTQEKGAKAAGGN